MPSDTIRPAEPLSISSSAAKPIDADLHDVFRLLYDGEEWELGSDEEAEEDLPESPESTPQAAEEPSLLTWSARLTRAQFLKALDSLLLPIPSRGHKRRIYPIGKDHTTVIPSTTPLPPLPTPTTYAPYSPLPLLARLRTFKTTTYPPLLPVSLGPLSAALQGWLNVGVDGLRCAHGCGSWGVGGLDRLPRRTRDAVVRRLSADLAAGSRHTPNCPWRIASSPAGLETQLRRLIHPLVAASLEPLSRALQRRTLSSPLTASVRWACLVPDKQLATLSAALHRYALANLSVPASDELSREQVAGTTQESGESATAPAFISRASALPPLDTLAVALALFGWYPYDPSFPQDYVSPSSASERQTPTEIVRCRICQRRVGLWAFHARQKDAELTGREQERTFDLGAAHLGWCPLYVDSAGSPAAPLEASTGYSTPTAASVSIDSQAHTPASATPWWDECSLLGKRVAPSQTTAEELTALLTVSERPPKRWRRS